MIGNSKRRGLVLGGACLVVLLSFYVLPTSIGRRIRAEYFVWCWVHGPHKGDAPSFWPTLKPDLPEAIIPLRREMNRQEPEPDWLIVEALAEFGESNLVIEAAIDGLKKRDPVVQEYWIKLFLPGGPLRRYKAQSPIREKLFEISQSTRD